MVESVCLVPSTDRSISPSLFSPSQLAGKGIREWGAAKQTLLKPARPARRLHQHLKSQI
jgi:hypothetical protein